MVSLKDNPRTFAEMDANIQRALDMLIPGFVTFDRQVQVEDSLVFYQLNQEPIGMIGRIELVKKDRAHIDISMQNASTPSEAEALNFQAFWEKEEHAEALAILTERALARNSKREADYRSIPSLKTATPTKLHSHFDQAIQMADRAKQELMKQRQAQLWTVTSIVLNRLNEEAIWEGERDRFSFKADLPTFWAILEQTISAMNAQNEPLEIARIRARDSERPSIEAVLFRPEMRVQGVSAIVTAQSMDDETTSISIIASEEIWNLLEKTWQEIRTELEQKEPVPPSPETIMPESGETTARNKIPSASGDSSQGESSSHETEMPADVESAAPDQDLIESRSRRGKRSHYSRDERDQAVKDWERTAKDSKSHTLVDFLYKKFGDDAKTYKLNVRPRTFYEWRTSFFKRNPTWTPENDKSKSKPMRKSKKNL